MVRQLLDIRAVVEGAYYRGVVLNLLEYVLHGQLLVWRHVEGPRLGSLEQKFLLLEVVPDEPPRSLFVWWQI